MAERQTTCSPVAGVTYLRMSTAVKPQDRPLTSSTDHPLLAFAAHMGYPSKTAWCPALSTGICFAMRDPTQVTAYHAHVYYRPETRLAAETLRDELDARFEVKLGRWHDAPVGPHPGSMYQVAFAPRVFADLVPWLILNRGPLDVLIHPETGDDLLDHRDHAMWLGEKLTLRLEVFAQSQ